MSRDYFLHAHTGQLWVFREVLLSVGWLVFQKSEQSLAEPLVVAQRVRLSRLDRVFLRVENSLKPQGQYRFDNPVYRMIMRIQSKHLWIGTIIQSVIVTCGIAIALLFITGGDDPSVVLVGTVISLLMVLVWLGLFNRWRSKNGLI